MSKEFELTIRCSKDIRKIILDFGNSRNALVDFSEDKKHSSRNQGVSDPFVDRLMNVESSQDNDEISISTPRSSSSIPNVENRPPLVDEGFNEPL